MCECISVCIDRLLRAHTRQHVSAGQALRSHPWAWRSRVFLSPHTFYKFQYGTPGKRAECSLSGFNILSWKKAREKYIWQVLFPRSVWEEANERLWKGGWWKRELVWFHIRSHIVALTVDQININHQMYLCHFSRNCNILQMCFSMVDKTHWEGKRRSPPVEPQRGGSQRHV